MTTDDLISILAADTTAQRGVFPDFLWVVFAPTAAMGAGFLWISGIRPDLSATATATAPATMWKWLLPMMIAAAGIGLAARLTHPEAGAGRLPTFLWFALGIGLWLAAGRMLALPANDWPAAVRGRTHAICVASIVGIGLPGLIAALLVLKRGAATRPRLTGLAAGLGCAGVATALYALHCSEDDPMFFVTWYGVAICLLGLAGAALGARMLRW